MSGAAGNGGPFGGFSEGMSMDDIFSMFGDIFGGRGGGFGGDSVVSEADSAVEVHNARVSVVRICA